jgi:DNA repair exonuclease SbcCD ATPase subunit
MRLRRLRVRDFRAIDDVTIEPLTTGVTIVEGPNEAGKSSLIEALSLLLNTNVKASSTAKDVRDIVPAGRDVASEVEAELEIGQYRLTYAKRYNRQPSTTLYIHEPQAGQFAGDDAHEQFRQIFTGHCDQALWDALRVQQAGGISQPDLAGAAALRTALERASGGATGVEDDQTATLQDKVKRELDRYYTTAQLAPRAELKSARDACGRAESDYQQLRSRLEEAEGLAEEVARLEEDIRRIERVLAEAQQELDGHAESLRAIEAAERDLETARAAVREAEATREHAALRLNERVRLREAVERLESESSALAEQQGRLEKELQDIQGAIAELRDERERRETAAAEARTTLQRATDDREIVRLRSELQNERERLERIAQLQRQQAEAERKLGAILVDRNALREITRASTEVEAARRQQQAGAATLRLTAMRQLDIEGPEGSETLEDGATREYQATSELHVELAGFASLDVTPPPSAAELAAAVRSAESTFAGMLHKYRVGSVDEAQDLLREREEAERIDKETPAEISRVLRDLKDVRALREKFERESGRLEKLMETLPPGYSLPSSISDAEERERGARTALAEAEQALKPLQVRHEELSRRDSDVGRRLAELNGELNRVRRDAEASLRQLQQVRDEATDEAIAKAVDAAKEAEGNALSALEQAQAAFETLDPGRVRALAENARGVVTANTKRLQETRDALTATRSLLDDRSRDGLFEQAEDAASSLEQARRTLERVERQAAAVRLLWETLETARRDAHRRYAGPLSERIRQYGSVLHGDHFDVELADDLSIERRTLGGVTLAFDQLSGGAKEQLALLARLATATLVDPAEGVPLIIDDALGYTDPQRLRLMGAVLAMAGRDCQVIVLTCYPGRYEHVGKAHFIRMS